MIASCFALALALPKFGEIVHGRLDRADGLPTAASTMAWVLGACGGLLSACVAI